MKKIVLLGCFVAILIYYLILDYRSQYYGLQSLFFTETSSWIITPKFVDYHPLSFVFLDKDGYEYIASGFKYNNLKFTVDSVVSYDCVNDSFLVVNCCDESDVERTLIVYTVKDQIIIESNPLFSVCGRRYNVAIDKIIALRAKKSITFILFLICLFLLKKYIWGGRIANRPPRE